MNFTPSAYDGSGYKSSRRMLLLVKESEDELELSDSDSYESDYHRR